MKRTFLLGLAFAGLLVSGATAQRTPHITNGTLTLEYRTDSEVGLVPLSFGYEGQTEKFVMNDPAWPAEGIWELQLCDPTSNPKHIFTINPEDPLCTFNFRTMGSWPPNVIHAIWSNIQYPGVSGKLRVRVTASIPSDGDAAEFRIHVTNNSDHSVFSERFPKFRFQAHTPDPSTEALVLSAANGIVVPDPYTHSFVALDDDGVGDPDDEWHMLPLRHPTGKYPQQMWALYSQVMAAPDILFGGTRDTNWILKDFIFDASESVSPPYLKTSLRTVLPDNLTAGNDQASLFPYVLSAFPGKSPGWYDAARFHQKWAEVNLPTLSHRIQENDAFSDIIREAKMFSTFTVQDEDPDNFQYWPRDIQDLRDYLDVREQPGHIYHWHNNPFGQNWGDWWPPKEAFLQVVPQIVALDFFHALYILLNSHHSGVPSFYDPDVPGYDEPLWQYVVRDVNGHFVGSLIDPGPYTICPDTDYFHDLLEYVFLRAADPQESDAFGIYLDVWSGGAGDCYATNHNHAPGGGAYWISAMRKAVADALVAVRSQPGKSQFFVTTEAFSASFRGEVNYGNYIGPYAKALVLTDGGGTVPLHANWNAYQKTSAPMTNHVQEIHPDLMYLISRRWLAGHVFFGCMPWSGSVLGPRSIYDNMALSGGYLVYMEMVQRMMDVLEEDGVRECFHFGERLRDPATDASLVDALAGDVLLPYRSDSQPVVYTACFQNVDETRFGLLFTNWTANGETFAAGGGTVDGGDQLVQYTIPGDEYGGPGTYQVTTYSPGAVVTDTRVLTAPYTATQLVPEKSAVFVLFERQ